MRPLLLIDTLAGRRFCLAGDVSDPIGGTKAGTDVRLNDSWPTGAEIDFALALAIDANDYQPLYDEAEASETRKELDAPSV